MKKISPYINPVYVPLPKSPNIRNTKGEWIWVLEKESLPYAESVYRPPPKFPDIPKLSRILLDFDTENQIGTIHTGKISLVSIKISLENIISINMKK